MKTLKPQPIVSLITCFLLILAVTICKGNKFQNLSSESGYKAGKQTEKSAALRNTDDGVLRYADDGILILSTGRITQDINGYAGNVPLEIYMQANRIQKVVALENAETSSYFAKIRNSDLLRQWDNLSPEEALRKEVDGISGATESSVAIIQSVQKGMEFVLEHPVEDAASSFSFDWVLFLGLLAGIALCTFLFTYFGKQPKAQMMQYVLNLINLALVIVVTALSIQPKSNQLTDKEETVIIQKNR